MKVEDESQAFLEDLSDEMMTEQEQEEGDEEEISENDEDEIRTHSHLLSGTGHRKIVTMVAIVAILLGLLISTYQTTQSKPKVIYAKRYSKEHRFRPAASPIITETLKDGRVRIRGAEPTTSMPPKPTPTAKRKRKGRSKSRHKKARA